MADLYLPPALSGERPLELKELMQRASAMRFVTHREKANLCATMVHVGIFFDGTNNNKARDQEEPLKRLFFRRTKETVL